MAYAGLSLEGRVALVTGSARGIGRALALGLAQAGADVAVSDMASRLEEARGVQAEIEALGRRSGTYEVDVLDVPRMRQSMDQLVDEMGRLDILVNNAGVRVRRPALEVTEDDWDRVVDTNLKGLFFCAQAAARHMVKRGEGRIINIASQLGTVGALNRSAYCASKGGVVNLTKTLALEWTPLGITVNAIGPGPTVTPGLLETDIHTADELQRDLEAHMPLGRRMEPEELVGACVYLASPSASATTGHHLIVDGGWTAL